MSRFDGCYGGKTDQANRRAFKRALDLLVEQSVIVSKSKDGDDWVCEPTPVEASGELFE